MLSIINLTGTQNVPFQLHKNQYIFLPDSIQLVHDLYLPETEAESFPVILIRTPYQKEGMIIFAEHFVRNGFAVMVQDVRGKNRSRGQFIPFINEKADGNFTLNWLSEQPWCDGNIGLWGSSYISYCALILADSGHPTLKGIFNLSGWIDGQTVNNPGGAMHQMLIIPWLLSEGQSSELVEQGADLEEIYAHTPLIEAIPGRGTMFLTEDGTEIDLDRLDSPFTYEAVEVPIFHVNGWYDFTIQATLEAYKKIRAAGQNRQYLLIGPWFHNQIYAETNWIGEHQISENAYLDIAGFLDLTTHWFNHTLKGDELEINYQGVNYYVLFQNKWLEGKQWPPSSEPQAYYLSPEHHLSPTKSDEINARDSFIYNPLDAVPTYGGANFYLFTEVLGIKNQSSIEAREDVLTYTTSPFPEEGIVAGNITASLYVQTEGKGTDFTAKLTLVDSLNQSLNIVDGITRVETARCGEGVFEVSIDLGDTAFRIAPGQSLRVQISSSNYPKFNRNPNTGIDPMEAITFVPVRQLIYCSKKYPSKIIIPFLKK